MAASVEGVALEPGLRNSHTHCLGGDHGAGLACAMASPVLRPLLRHLYRGGHCAGLA